MRQKYHTNPQPTMQCINNDSTMHALNYTKLVELKTKFGRGVKFVHMDGRILLGDL